MPGLSLPGLKKTTDHQCKSIVNSLQLRKVINNVCKLHIFPNSKSVRTLSVDDLNFLVGYHYGGVYLCHPKIHMLNSDHQKNSIKRPLGCDWLVCEGRVITTGTAILVKRDSGNSLTPSATWEQTNKQTQQVDRICGAESKYSPETEPANALMLDFMSWAKSYSFVACKWAITIVSNLSILQCFVTSAHKRKIDMLKYLLIWKKA